ncbi:MAG: hypothetical protein U0U67_13340 [Chitinophagales bacterium]
METHLASNVISYLLQISVEHKERLGSIRHWQNLKLAFDDSIIWVKDFTKEQVESIQVKQIPFKELFYFKDNLLFKIDSLVPEKKMHSGLLWTPINRALQVELPSLNHNYFGINEAVNIKLIEANAEHESCALLTTINVAADYINTATAIRLKNLKWCMINKDLFIIGKPLLPLIGKTFWMKNDFLLPTGFDFELTVLEQTLKTLLNPHSERFIVWKEDASYVSVDKNEVRPLSISSFRQTIAAI